MFFFVIIPFQSGKCILAAKKQLHYLSLLRTKVLQHTLAWRLQMSHQTTATTHHHDPRSVTCFHFLLVMVTFLVNDFHALVNQTWTFVFLVTHCLNDGDLAEVTSTGVFGGVSGILNVLFYVEVIENGTCQAMKSTTSKVMQDKENQKTPVPSSGVTRKIKL